MFSITLTDSRLIQRRQDCACCGTGPRSDKMLFLSDLSTITDSVGGKSCSLRSCNPCSCSLCGCIRCCIAIGGKEIGLTGPFGTEVFTFASKDVSDALFQIPAAALPHKM